RAAMRHDGHLAAVQWIDLAPEALHPAFQISQVFAKSRRSRADVVFPCFCRFRVLQPQVPEQTTLPRPEIDLAESRRRLDSKVMRGGDSVRGRQRPLEVARP